MKHISDFVTFDCEGFFKPKKLVITQITAPNKDEKDTSIVSRVEVVVLDDNSSYVLSKTEIEKGVTEVNNLYEKIFFKSTSKEGFKVGDTVQPITPSGKVYVNGRNTEYPKIDVSLKCSGFTVVHDKKA